MQKAKPPEKLCAKCGTYECSGFMPVCAPCLYDIVRPHLPAAGLAAVQRQINKLRGIR